MGPAHLGVAFAVKPLTPKVSLWTLLAASETLDLLAFFFMALGIERDAVTQTRLEHGVTIQTPAFVPWSHGLPMSIIWSLVAGFIAYLFYRDRKVSVMVSLVVFSHWILDVLVHPGLPLFFDNTRTVGLGLWMSRPGLIASLVLEIGLLVSGILVYVIWRRKKRNYARKQL